jgi:pimeloyl-ACP methyl ester carboxylesterase
VLFVAGATGDGGHFDRVAELLSDEFTVLTYDRRGNSRSPRPDGWEGTSTEEHSEDAAVLIEALGIAPVAIFGTSAGAIIGLDLAIRHPELVRGAILHEPPMTAGMANPEEVMGAIQQVVEGGMQRGRVEAFIRLVDGDEVFENLDPQLRERMLRNGETCLVTEMPVFPAYAPDEATLAAVEVPMRVMVGPTAPSASRQGGSPASWASSWRGSPAGTLLTLSGPKRWRRRYVRCSESCPSNPSRVPVREDGREVAGRLPV